MSVILVAAATIVLKTEQWPYGGFRDRDGVIPGYGRIESFDDALARWRSPRLRPDGRRELVLDDETLYPGQSMGIWLVEPPLPGPPLRWVRSLHLENSSKKVMESWVPDGFSRDARTPLAGRWRLERPAGVPSWLEVKLEPVDGCPGITLVNHSYTQSIRVLAPWILEKESH